MAPYLRSACPTHEESVGLTGDERHALGAVATSRSQPYPGGGQPLERSGVATRSRELMV